MSTVIDDILDKIEALEKDLEREFEARRERFQYRLEKHRVRFEHDMVQRHRLLRKGLLGFWRDSQFLNFITSPVIYALVVPLILLDLSLSFFQWACFPIYGIRKVTRGDYVVIDRHHLAYLNLVEKLNCVYCGYANGVIAYAREIASRTEQRWCPIKHARRAKGVHARYYQFDDYGDAENFRKRDHHRKG
ncbi:MAG: hypothetical protein HQL36_04420 [Alphaproteobacteria bacterium]|nr:hypothetical protein [Alphaproteobacteria bacterium]MBF0250361.1 hypothetical protein [Alphaproteobacteria bacterium]